MNARDWVAVSLLNDSQETTTTLGAAVDLSPYANQANREMKAIFAVSGLTTTTTLTAAVTECATTNGSYTAPANGTSTQVITTNGVYEINFRNDLRYVKAGATLNATGLANIVAVAVVLNRYSNS